ncbi:uncharacterized protein LOC144711413 [Wolffia australiana]
MADTAIHHHQARPKSSSASFNGCCCCFFLLLFLLAASIAAASLAIALALKPKKPQFDLQQVRVSYLLVSPQSHLSLNLSMLFMAENPNKVAISFSPASFPVLYRGLPLGFAELPPFQQPAHSIRLLETRLVVDRADVSDQGALVRDAVVDDRVEFRVAGDVGAKIRLMGFTSPRVQVSVDCAIVISPRKQSLEYKQCGVDGLNV